MKLFIYDQKGAFVAQIALQPKLAQGFNPDEPWLLLHNTGRTDRFAKQAEAKAEARKSWGNCRFSRN